MVPARRELQQRRRGQRERRARLGRRRWFDDVRIRFEEGSSPETKDVVLKVVESKTGSILLGGGVSSNVGFFANLVYAFVAGKKAPANYWGEGATTLEWTLSSPPPYHQFSELPVIEDHHTSDDHISKAHPA